MEKELKSKVLKEFAEKKGIPVVDVKLARRRLKTLKGIPKAEE